jgi:hypothetical protein
MMDKLHLLLWVGYCRGNKDPWDFVLEGRMDFSEDFFDYRDKWMMFN